MQRVTVAIIQHIQEVISNTTVPTWVGSVPNKFGESVTGTLKADEWRTLATIYLPLALIGIWGEGSVHPDKSTLQAARKILDHTMLLVSAISLACRRTTSPSIARSYWDCITSYIKVLHTLHPHARYTPNLHLAVHIHDFLHLFGPVHSWWTFPFERLIGHLQKINTNHHFGTTSLFLQSHSFTHFS